MVTQKQDYNNVPVAYCKTCLSLAVVEVNLSSSVATDDTIPKICYCSKCSNTEVEEAHITEWEEKYEQRFGKKFLDEDNK